jgi:DtxR family transcriptional regulator, Mn-dependent transcriptional regulator
MVYDGQLVPAKESRPPATSESVDDYLKAILELGGAEDRLVTGNALAARLGVRPASVTNMLQKLVAQRPALVAYQKHQGVRLTTAGKRRAWELVRHHRLLELFLHDVLKYPWDEVHEEAERLEHFISERFEDRVAAVLGDPGLDPHGHLIPQEHKPGSFPAETPLNDWPVGEEATIASVSDRDPTALREIERLGLRPGATILVDQKNSNDCLFVRLVEGTALVRLNGELAGSIFVQTRATS